MRRDVFQAIADPTRREIINLVAHKSLNLNAVAENFNVSRPAISKHIKILTECGLIVIHQQGRERYCEARLEKLNEVSGWVEKYKKFWNTRLDALEVYLSELQVKEKTDLKKKSPGTTKQKTKKSKSIKRNTNK
jgi:DNA-binding transcriptional ArsR family regulator